MAKVPFQADRIFSQAESGRPKTEVLRLLEDRHPGTSYHFVEDKVGTLEKVCPFSCRSNPRFLFLAHCYLEKITLHTVVNGETLPCLCRA